MRAHSCPPPPVAHARVHLKRGSCRRAQGDDDDDDDESFEGEGKVFSSRSRPLFDRLSRVFGTLCWEGGGGNAPTTRTLVQH